MQKIKYQSTKNPILSIIVPISNMAGKLGYLQSWSSEIEELSIEVILVHDTGDTDTSKELKNLISGSKNPEKFTIIEGRFGGPGLARNKGLEIAEGKWVAFWDSDDQPRLSTVYKYVLASNNSDEIIVGGFITYNASNGHLNHNNAKNASMTSVSINPGVWRMVFRSSLIKKNRFTNLRAAEDQLFLANIKFTEKQIKFVFETFYTYTIGQKNQLTNSVKALSDIPIASKAIYFLCLESDSNQKNFYLMMIIRQQITLLKHGNYRSKISVINFIILYFKKANCSLVLATIKTLLSLTMNIKRNYLR